MNKDNQTILQDLLPALHYKYPLFKTLKGRRIEMVYLNRVLVECRNALTLAEQSYLSLKRLLVALSVGFNVSQSIGLGPFSHAY